MRMVNPMVTIAVPSLNQGRYLERALSSIFEQDIRAEVFVMDGGSKDASPEIIRRFEPQLAGWRSHADQGQAAAINEGIARGTAPYVCWLNSDDYYLPGGLAALVAALRGDPEPNWAYGRCWTVSSRGRKTVPYLTLPFWPRIFASFCFVAQPATLISRPAWESLGGLDEHLHLAFDYDLWWRLYGEFGKPHYLRRAVAATRAHRDTKTANYVERHYQESIGVVETHWGKAPMKWRLALPLMKILRRSDSASQKQ
jgi:glycosyltransferase involved in cell wall biosynthesis